jgi:hypothetical protein
VVDLDKGEVSLLAARADLPGERFLRFRSIHCGRRGTFGVWSCALMMMISFCMRTIST